MMHTAAVIVFAALFVVLVYGFVRYLLIPQIRGTSYVYGPEEDDDSSIGMLVGASVGTAIGSVVAAEAAEAYEHHHEDPPADDEAVSDKDDDTVSDD